MVCLCVGRDHEPCSAKIDELIDWGCGLIVAQRTGVLDGGLIHNGYM